MAEADTEAKGKGEAAKAPADASKANKLLPVLLGVNCLLLVAVLAAIFLRPGAARAAKGGEAAAGHAEPAAHAEAPKAPGGKDGKPVGPGPTLKLPDFVVHLRDTDADRYARLSLEVEVADEKAKEVVTARMPLIRDAFLSHLSDRSAEELRGSEALGRVKAALARKLGEVAPGAPVRAVYLTEIVVQ